MHFPDAETIANVLDAVEFPRFFDARYEPATPRLDAVERTAREEAETLLETTAGDLPSEATIAVGLGSRGITDVLPVARATIDAVRSQGFEPVVLPAMGSHGGATGEGQRRTLASLGLTEDALSCAIDARMDTVALEPADHTDDTDGVAGDDNENDSSDDDAEGGGSYGDSDHDAANDAGVDGVVHVSRAALDADGVLVVNRVKPHTNFTGAFESGLSKMLAIGLGKQAGAQRIHERALVRGYVSEIEAALGVIREHATVLGGIAIVENFDEETAAIEAVAGEALPQGEAPLLERAREYMPTLPFEELDVLVVDRIGKDVSGTGMDTNVIGRYQALNTDDPDRPRIDRIAVLGLTEATHGNGMGIGLADVTTTAVAEALDLEQVYANALTSASLSKAAVPVALPTDELAVSAALSSVGPYDPETIEVAWIRDTSHLRTFRVSAALAERTPPSVEIVGETRPTFDGGTAAFEPIG